MLKLLLGLAVSFSLSPTLIPGKCGSFPDKFLKKQSPWRSSAELCQKMRGNMLEGKRNGLLIVFLFFFLLPELVSGKKNICDCSFIYLSTNTVLICGWQWLLIVSHSNVTLALIFGNVIHVIQIMHINSVLADQATLKSGNYVLPVFIHSVNSWNNKCCTLLFITQLTRSVSRLEAFEGSAGWGSESVEKGAHLFIKWPTIFIQIGQNVLKGKRITNILMDRTNCHYKLLWWSVI